MPTEVNSKQHTGVTPTRNGSARNNAVKRLMSDSPLAGPLTILVVLMIAFTIINANFFTLTNLQALIDAAAVPLIVAVGLTFVIITGSIDLSVEGVIATVSLTAALLLANSINDNDLGWGAVAIGIAVGAVFGLVNGVLYTKLRLPSLIVTLGTWFVGLGLAAALFPANPPAVQDAEFRSMALDNWFGLQRLDFIAVAFVLAAAFILRVTRFGRTLYAIGSAEDLVHLAGIRVDRYKIGAFVISGLASAVAAVLLTSQLGIGNVDSGSNQLFPGISAVVLGGTLLSGGRGGIAQTTVGVLILTVLSNGMILSGVSPYVQQAVVGAIIIAAVVAAGWRSRSPLRIVK